LCAESNGRRTLLLRLTELPVVERIRAFNTAFEMKKRGIRTIDIYYILKKEGLPIKYETVRSWVTGHRNPLNKLNVITELDGNLVELIGMSLGDGTWRKVIKDDSYKTGRALYGSKDLELAIRAGGLMAKVLGKAAPYRPYWSESNGVYVVECGSKHLVETLSVALERLVGLIHEHPVRFLKGIYNAEGSVCTRTRNGRVYPRVFLTNSDWRILTLTRDLLKSIGIRSTLELNTKAGKRKKIMGIDTVSRVDVYNICIGTRLGVLAFAHNVGFGVRRKDDLLRRIVRHLNSGLLT
jgi:intein-encoded DNA endonuclease-like protein